MEHELLHMTMLFDFYGELLTEKQREYFDLYHNEDLSLSEIADKAGISRHGVYDFVKRAENILIETEEKTGIVKKWMYTQEEIEKAIKLAEEIIKNSNNRYLDLAIELLNVLEGIDH